MFAEPMQRRIVLNYDEAVRMKPKNVRLKLNQDLCKMEDMKPLSNELLTRLVCFEICNMPFGMYVCMFVMHS